MSVRPSRFIYPKRRRWFPMVSNTHELWRVELRGGNSGRLFFFFTFGEIFPSGHDPWDISPSGATSLLRPLKPLSEDILRTLRLISVLWQCPYFKCTTEALVIPNRFEDVFEKFHDSSNIQPGTEPVQRESNVQRRLEYLLFIRLIRVRQILANIIRAVKLRISKPILARIPSFDYITAAS